MESKVTVTNPSSESSMTNDHEDDETLMLDGHVRINFKPSSQKLFGTDLSGYGTWVSDMKIERGQRVEPNTETLSRSTTEETGTLVSWRNDTLNLDRGVDGYIEFMEQFPKQFDHFVISKNRRIFVLPPTEDEILLDLLIRTGSKLLTVYARKNDLYFVAFQVEGKEIELPFKIGEILFPNITKGAWRQQDNKYALESLSYSDIQDMAQATIDDVEVSIDGIKNAVIQLSEDNCSEDLISSGRSILIILYGVFETIRFKTFRNLVIFNTKNEAYRRSRIGGINIIRVDRKFNLNSNHAFLSEKGNELDPNLLVWCWSELSGRVFNEKIKQFMNEDLEFDELKDLYDEVKEDKVFKVNENLYSRVKTYEDIFDTINLFKMSPSVRKNYNKAIDKLMENWILERKRFS